MSSSCTTSPSGVTCSTTSSNWSTCKPWQLTEQSRTNCYADSLIQESLSIAGANINVFKLLGVHEQTRLVDVAANGTPISGGDQAGFGAENAFTSFRTEWKSVQRGDAVISSAYIGYDFGVVKLPSGRVKYGIDANNRATISTIRIKQGKLSTERATKVRVERSEDGKSWYGVAIIQLPNTDALSTVSFKETVPSRYWRLRPVTMSGSGCDGWTVQALELIEYAVTALDNIQDPILMENRDRDYAMQSQLLKGYYDLVNTATDLTRFGFELPTQNYQIKVNFNSCVSLLGRPVIIGDLIELPSEAQYSPTLQPIKKYLEVTDVSWDTASYTPGWMPTMLLITTASAMASQETQSVFGDLGVKTDNSGLFNGDDGKSKVYQDFTAIDQTIRAEANTQVPERGSEGSNVIREFSEDEITSAVNKGYTAIDKLQFNRTELYVEDAMPQNGELFTEASTFPTTPRDGDYHRLTYEGLAAAVPARLYRWSDRKDRWIFLETDKRAQFNPLKPVLTDYITAQPKQFASKIK